VFACLDGETNLKSRAAVNFAGFKVDVENALFLFKGVVTVDNPNNRLYVFNGSMDVDDGSDKPPIPLDNKYVLLRTCVLKATAYVYGLVVYTGKEAKIMMNSVKPPLKTTKLETLLNVFVFIAFVIQLLFCAFCAISGFMFFERVDDHYYLQLGDISISGQSALKFVQFIILIQTLIPISLYVTLEVVKLGQVIFINQDVQMYDEEFDVRANARTSNLNENLFPFILFYYFILFFF
jgi:magnesium-transporting ATPase (P-type)